MEKILRMSNREGECFFLLLAKAAEAVEMTESQLTIIEYLEDETDEDANGRGYCIVHDEKYQELAPWSSARRKYECIYGR